MPKAQPFSAPHVPPPLDDEEEKTTIESGWEEEASTTVEQGEVAEKIRALGLDAPRRQQITNTGNVMDEPTVDDQRANAALSMITPPSVLARMIITHGNDKGQEVEIIPGKNYTIGRAIDNDIVLTDIAVSRKHFDMRYENSAWVLADRGSGNGTLVNGNVEDQPFMLANGDLIEIGNTTFRFDYPNAPPRSVFAENQPTNGFASTRTNGKPYAPIDEEEPSTVAGKPVRDDIVLPSQNLPSQNLPSQNHPTPNIQTPPMPELRTARPKTVPPPLPPRARSLSNPPPMPYPNGNGSQPMPSAAAVAPTIGPHQGMSPVAPQMMAPVPAPMARVLASQAPTLLGDPAMQLPGVMPATIPGQGPPIQPQPPHINQLPFTYPNVADHAAHARMMVASSHIPRDATATAHVPPTPFNGAPAMAYNTYAPPPISRRTKLLLGGAGLAIVAAIATAAIIKAASSDDSPEVGDTTEPPKKAEPKQPIVQPIVEPKQAPPKKDPPKQDPVVTNDPPKKDPPVVDPPKKDVVVEAPKKDVDPPKDPPKQDPVATNDPPKKDPPKKDPPKKDPPKKDPPKKDPPVIAKKDPPKKDPPKKDPPKDPPKKDPPRKDREKRVAVAGGGDAAKTTAAALFRNRKFNEAAATLKSAAAGLSGGDASELKSIAGRYESFGRKFSVGMAPQTKQSEAWGLLISARSFDSEGAFRDEINGQINKIASTAAMQFLGAKNYPKALEAARVAETNGAKNTMSIVRSKIDEYAAELYAAASREIDSNPTEAKQKLRLIKGLVEPKSTWALKADKLLAGI